MSKQPRMTSPESVAPAPLQIDSRLPHDEKPLMKGDDDSRMPKEVEEKNQVSGNTQKFFMVPSFCSWIR